MQQNFQFCLQSLSVIFCWTPLYMVKQSFTCTMLNSIRIQLVIENPRFSNYRWNLFHHVLKESNSLVSQIASLFADIQPPLLIERLTWLSILQFTIRASEFSPMSDDIDNCATWMTYYLCLSICKLRLLVL